MTQVPTPSTDDTVRHVIHHERAVGWFDLRQLVSTAFKTVTSTVIGSMTGRRELMAALDPLPRARSQLYDYSTQDEIWLDYVSDTGDGWDATYSVAYLVGRDQVDLGKDGRLPGGQILVLGGDEVYPTASSEEYQARLVDPYYCARPWQEPGRDLFALPGNHDWYDGLTSFIRLFCQNRQQRWIGAWCPRQRRSYFAIKLPHRWWLWGIDLALEDDLDPPQYDYFAKFAKRLSQGDRLIVCIPEPLWVGALPPDELGKRSSKIWDKLKLIEQLALDRGATIPVWLAGDLHHYARYESQDGSRQYITCGGGGAFLLGTHGLPERLELPSGQAAEQRQTFPDRRESRRMSWRALQFSWRSKGFTVGLTAVQLFLFWLIQLAWLQMVAPAKHDWLAALWRSPGAIFWLGVCILGFVAFARSGSKPPKSVVAWSVAGLVHAALQIGGAQLLLWWLARPHGPPVALSILVGVPVLYGASGTLFGAYLLASERAFGNHLQEVFSCQAVADWKCFLRLHITADRLTIHPIGIQTICTSWKIAAGVVLRKTWSWRRMMRADVLDVPERAKLVYEPAEPLYPKLIEKPIVIKTPAASAGPGR